MRLRFVAMIVFSLVAVQFAFANGPPASIILHIVGGPQSELGNADYQTGSSVKLEAEVLDANGQPADTSKSPCTPVYVISDNFTPGGISRAHLVGDHVIFDEGPGRFTVQVHCAENPEISSADNTMPFDFQTTPKPKPGQAPTLAKTGGEDFVQSHGGVLGNVSEMGSLPNDSGGSATGSATANGGGAPTASGSSSGMSALGVAAIIGGVAAGVVAIAAAAGASSGGGSCQSGYHSCGSSGVCCPSGYVAYCSNTNKCYTSSYGLGSSCYGC